MRGAFRRAAYAQPASENVNAETTGQIFGEFFMSRLPLMKQSSMTNGTGAGIAGSCGSPLCHGQQGSELSESNADPTQFLASTVAPVPGSIKPGPVDACKIVRGQHIEWSSLICNSGDSVAPASLWSPVLGLKRDLTARFARTSSVGRHLGPALGVSFHGLVIAIERSISSNPCPSFPPRVGRQKTGPAGSHHHLSSSALDAAGIGLA